MTRMWMVSTEYLCREHLLGEHSEMHQEGGTLVNHPHGRAIVMGHAKVGQVDTTMLERRHDELAEEMRRRGYEHDSPFDYDIDEPLGYVDEHANLVELYNRCERCRERIDECA